MVSLLLICTLLHFNLQIKVQNLSVDSTATSDLDSLNDVYNTLLKQKEDICKEINMLKYKGKMFPPIVKQQCTKEERYSTGDQFSSIPTAGKGSKILEKEEEDSGESWTIDNEEESYNMEFNVEPKKSTLSKQSSQLMKQQLSYYGSFENIEEVYGENEWNKYLDEEMTIPPEDVEDISNDVLGKVDEMQNKLSDLDEDNGSVDGHTLDIELNYGEDEIIE